MEIEGAFQMKNGALSIWSFYPRSSSWVSGNPWSFSWKSSYFASEGLIGEIGMWGETYYPTRSSSFLFMTADSFQHTRWVGAFHGRELKL